MKKKTKKFQEIHPSPVVESDSRLNLQLQSENERHEELEFEKCDLVFEEEDSHHVPKKDMNNTLCLADLDCRSQAPTTRSRKTRKKRSERNCYTERGFERTVEDVRSLSTEIAL